MARRVWDDRTQDYRASAHQGHVSLRAICTLRVTLRPSTDHRSVDETRNGASFLVLAPMVLNASSSPQVASTPQSQMGAPFQPQRTRILS